MSVIQSIRDKGAWIIFGIIALALIAFILQDGVRRGGSSTDNTTLGKVNGEKIERLAFEEKLTMQERMYGPQGAQREQLIGSLWNQEVERIVLQQEYDKLGLQITGKELTEILFGENSPLKQEFTDPKTGVFRANDAKQAFAQIKKSKNAEQVNMINAVYITPTIEQGLRMKYQGLLQQSAYVPKWLIEKQQADNNAVASISYTMVPFSSISDSTVKATDEEISDYVSKHANEFKKEEETRTIAYVAFNAAPSSTDSLTTLNQIKSLKAEFASTTDAKSFLGKVGSDVSFYDSYFSKSKLQQVNKDSLTALSVGSLYGPYLDASNYVIAKMVGVKQWPDSVTVRHILIGTQDPRSGQAIRSDSTGQKLADSIATAIKSGADFGALCAKYSDDQGSKDKGGVYEYFPQGKMVLAFNDFAFDKPVGAKAVVKTEFGYHYMEVLKQTPRGPAYKIAYLSKALLPSTETINAASTAAAQFASGTKDVKSFNSNAVKINKQVLPATNIKANDYNIAGIGESRSMVRWAFEKDVNDVSEPFEVGDSYYVAIITGEEKQGLLNVDAARPQVEGIIRDQQKAEKIKATLKGASLEALAASGKTTVQRADSVGFSFSMLPGVGNEPKVVGASFNKGLVNKVSEPIAGNTGVFALTVNAISAKPAQQDPALFKEENLQRLRSGLYRTNIALKKVASIEDNRTKIY